MNTGFSRCVCIPCCQTLNWRMFGGYRLIWLQPIAFNCSDQFAKVNAQLMNSGMAGLLFRIRFFIGRLFKWDEKQLQDHLIPGSMRFRYAQQESLTYDDLPDPGSGIFNLVYK